VEVEKLFAIERYKNNLKKEFYNVGVPEWSNGMDHWIEYESKLRSFWQSGYKERYCYD